MHNGCINRSALIQHLFSRKIVEVYEVSLVRYNLSLLLSVLIQYHATVNSSDLRRNQ